MLTISSADKSRWIKNKAIELGFADVGYAKATLLQEEAKRLQQWLNLGYQGEMAYMKNHFDKRTDPRKLVPGAKTVICFLYNYYTENKQVEGSPKISMYAHGRDYHKVVKRKLKELYNSIEEEFGSFLGRYFVDSAPILERDWAKKSGLGWIGKNTLLINPKKGSYFFLAEMIVDFELDYDEAIQDYCGSCTKCIDACPTNAIDKMGYLMDGSKCISYLTIELKNDIPVGFQGQMENNIFGCDICQEVCPWNRFSIVHNENEFVANEELMSMDKEDWNKLSEEKFDSLFEGSAVKRTGYTGLKRNIDFLNK